MPPVGQYNAATLAQSLYSGWQSQAPVSVGGPLAGIQPQQPNMLGVQWGAELLPSILGSDDGQGMSVGSPPDQGSFEVGDSTVSGGRPVHKTRFVWTAELHRRFEAAVNTLGIDHAKPQAISQLMNCEGEGAPTRQNIKSHLQKYRLLMQKRARQEPALGQGPSAVGGGGELKQEFGQVAGEQAPLEVTDAQSALDQHLARQEMNLKVQMNLQTRLHRQLLVQRQLQHQLDHSLNAAGELDGVDKTKWRATLSLKNNLRERLTKHVEMQQEMLHHLDALVSS